MNERIEIREFARRVERLCDFLLDRISQHEQRNGSPNIRVIEDLKEEAANIQFHRINPVSETFDGLDTYMHGLNAPFEEAKKE